MRALDLSSSRTVVQANALIEASYSLNLDEQRIIITAISKIDARGDDLTGSLTISAYEYAELWGLNINAAYQQLKDATERLFERKITVINAKDSSGIQIDELRWIYRRAVYHEREGKVSLSFSPDLKPYLCNLKEKFTMYHLSDVSGLKKVYSIRLFELLKQYFEVGGRWITVEKFRSILELNEKYKKFAELKRWVIMPAIKELNQKTKYDISFSAEKKGRAVVKIWFDIKLKEKK